MSHVAIGYDGGINGGKGRGGEEYERNQEFEVRQVWPVTCFVLAFKSTLNLETLFRDGPKH